MFLCFLAQEKKIFSHNDQVGGSSSRSVVEPSRCDLSTYLRYAVIMKRLSIRRKEEEARDGRDGGKGKREKARTASRDIGRMQGPLSPLPSPQKTRGACTPSHIHCLYSTGGTGGNLDTAAKHDLHDRTSTTQLRFHESCHL